MTLSASRALVKRSSRASAWHVRQVELQIERLVQQLRELALDGTKLGGVQQLGRSAVSWPMVLQFVVGKPAMDKSEA